LGEKRCEKSLRERFGEEQFHPERAWGKYTKSVYNAKLKRYAEYRRYTEVVRNFCNWRIRIE
jgi:hypothetical protein